MLTNRFSGIMYDEVHEMEDCEQIVKYCERRWILRSVSGEKVCSVGYKMKKHENIDDVNEIKMKSE